MNAQLHLVLGEEELLAERAVAAVVADVRARAGDIPVTRVHAREAVAELAEHLSPSLFAEERVVVVESADAAGKAAIDIIMTAAEDPPMGVTLIVLHSGGGIAKAAAGKLQKLGATVHEAAALKRGAHAGFVKREFAAQGVQVATPVAQQLVEAVGTNLRELAAAVSQLVADTGGKRIDAAAVARYYSGRAEVSGFAIADEAVAGNVGGALESLRWALSTGVAHVLIADALADGVASIAKAGGGGSPAQLGMPPWKIEKARKTARIWSAPALREALAVVADVNGAVKGSAADPDYALETAVRRVAQLAASGAASARGAQSRYR
jgi:DNA polymerase-3 subunit delta